MFVCGPYVNSHQTVMEGVEEKRETCSGWLLDRPWLRSADESCLGPQFPWRPTESSQTKKKKRNEAKGRGLEGGIEEKELDGKR